MTTDTTAMIEPKGPRSSPRAETHPGDPPPFPPPPTTSPYVGELRCFGNLGHVDVVPKGSGKVRAAQYVAKKWGARAEDAVMLMDDDNDLELAAWVGRAFVPTVSHESVYAAVAKDPGHFVLSEDVGGGGGGGSGAEKTVVGGEKIMGPGPDVRGRREKVRRVGPLATEVALDELAKYLLRGYSSPTSSSSPSPS
jgi:hypothetical protein